jgi:site-specific recombinase XerD
MTGTASNAIVQPTLEHTTRGGQQPLLTVRECELLAKSWHLSLRAERKSPSTLKSYGDGLRAYLGWCARQGVEPLLRASLAGWVADLIDTGSAAATARSRQLAVRRFAAWLHAEDEVPTDPFLGVKPPKLDEQVTEPHTVTDLKALIAACTPPRGADAKVKMRYVRDEAILRLMAETGARAGEVVALTLDDIDLARGVAVIRRGKGGKGRIVPFGPETAKALDRYQRLRRTHRLAGTPNLWVGDRGKGFTYDALHKTLAMRAKDAGVTGFHPHRLRHTAAHRWLAAGGSETGLMAVGGWTRPDMLVRYTKARAAERAAEEARSLNLGAF